MYKFNLFMAKPLRKKYLGQNLDFCGSYFQFLLQNWVFGTNMESNTAVTLHFEDIAVRNYLFLKDVWFVGEIVICSTFDECEVVRFKLLCFLTCCVNIFMYFFYMTLFPKYTITSSTFMCVLTTKVLLSKSMRTFWPFWVWTCLKDLT